MAILAGLADGEDLLEPKMCRLCFEVGQTEDEMSEGKPLSDDPLICPCNCKGTQQYIHKQCLMEWLQQLKAQGRFAKASRCDICHARWDPKLVQLPVWAQSALEDDAQALVAEDGRPFTWAQMQRRRLRRMIFSVRASLYTQPWPVHLLRVWKLYLLCAGLNRAAREGAVGVRAGARLGRALVEEQSAAVVALLSAVAGMLGTPAAELLWIQVVAAVAFALASEFLYALALGAVLGAVTGFFKGYMQAFRGSTLFIANNTNKLLHLGAQMGLKMLRNLAGGAAVLRNFAGRALRLNLLLP